MREVTKQMIEDYRILRLGYDFMGYDANPKQDLSFHHLIVPRRDCSKMGLGEGYFWWNGAILNQKTAHDYLHLIEAKDYDMFMAITSEMIDENAKGYLDIKNLQRISDVLSCFEREHCSDRGKKGRLLIKDDYVGRRKF